MKLENLAVTLPRMNTNFEQNRSENIRTKIADVKNHIIEISIKVKRIQIAERH